MNNMENNGGEDCSNEDVNEEDSNWWSHERSNEGPHERSNVGLHEELVRFGHQSVARCGELKKCLLGVSEHQDEQDVLFMSFLKKHSEFDMQFSSWKNASTHTMSTLDTAKRKQEKGIRSRDRAKGWKPNEICFQFSHSVDYKEHIRQYRVQYTYKTRTYNKNITSGQTNMTVNQDMYSAKNRHYKPPVFSQPRPIGRMKYEHRQYSPKLLTYTSSRAQSEPDILNLQHRYKIDPRAIKKALIANLNEPIHGVDVTSEPDDGHDPLDDVEGFWKNPVRAVSAASAKATIHSRISGTVNLTPTNAARHGTLPHLHSGSTIPSPHNTNSHLHTGYSIPPSPHSSPPRDEVVPRTASHRSPLVPLNIQPIDSYTNSMPSVLLSNVASQLRMDPHTMLVLNDLTHFMYLTV